MDTNKNSYTFAFATIMVIIVAFILAFLATALKPLQDANLEQEKQQNFLKTIGVELSREQSAVEFTNYIKKGLLVNDKGEVVEEADGDAVAKSKAFKSNVKAAMQNKEYPIFIAEKDGNTYYIIPLHGMGMWSDIMGNVALAADKNTIAGINFDHKSETSGLGAEIVTDWFQANWVGKQILKDPNAGFTADNFASVATVKGGAADDDKHGVDAISGGTVTSDAVSVMFKQRLSLYLPYFNNLK